MRIIHISDLHFGMHNPAIIEPFLEDLALLKPEQIIISGDVTQRALQEQYEQLQLFLKRLPAPFLIVPGNHDIPLYDPFSRLFHPFKRYKHYISPQLEASFSNEEVNILGVNSVTPYKIKDGTLDEQTFNRIKKHFSATTGQLNILFFHHNLNYFSGMHHPLNDAPEFINYLENSPIHIVCTGHLHYANIKLISKKSGGSCAILHAGSLCCQRSKDNLNSFYLIDSNNLKCTIDWRVFNNDIFSSRQLNSFDFTT